MSENTITLKKVEKGNELALSLDVAAEELKNAWLTEGNFARTIAYGMAVAKMRDVLNDKVMTSLVKLKNSKMGFRTDEGNGFVYPVQVVRDCIIEAATLGLQCTGNQFNIIGGNMYVTKEGFTFLLRELARSGQLKNMKFIYHPAVISDSSTQGTRRDGTQYQKVEREGKAKVDVCWEFNGVAGSEQLEFVIRVNAGMSQDAVIGKAERKAKAWLFNHLTDQAVSDGSADAQDELWRDKEALREVTSKVSEPSFLQAAQQAGPVGLPGLKAGKPVMPVQTEVVEAAANYEVQGTNYDVESTQRLHPELHDDDAVPVNWPVDEPTFPEVLPLDDEA